MNELLNKRMADMTLRDVMEASHLVEVSKSITLTLDEFCRITAKPRRRVYSLIDNKILPEELICGGYENRKQKTKLLFHTHKVIEWLKQ